MTRDPVDMRILGALRVIDAITRAPISTPLAVSAPRVRVIRNLSGLYVIAETPKTAAYSGSFDLPVPATPPDTVIFTIVDRSGRYLPRTASVTVPRDLDPAHSALATSVFRPIDVEMFASPTMPIGEGWATVRLSVKRSGSQVGLPYAFVRIVRTSDNVVLARGLADERGEVLIGVPGIPVTTWSTDDDAAVTTSTVAAKVAACFDPVGFDAAAGTYPDPKSLEQAFSTLPHSTDLALDLASGHEVARRIDVTIPP